MKSVGEILQDLGFNKNAPKEVQIAFFKNLLAAQRQTPIVLNTEARVKTQQSSRQKPEQKTGEQLEFDLLKALTS